MLVNQGRLQDFFRGYVQFFGFVCCCFFGEGWVGGGGLRVGCNGKVIIFRFVFL